MSELSREFIATDNESEPGERRMLMEKGEGNPWGVVGARGEGGGRKATFFCRLNSARREGIL